MTSTTSITETIIPFIVGLAALALLDSSLGNWSTDGFRTIFKHKEVRILALFGAAYGANGGRIMPALLAILLYNFLENDTTTYLNFFGVDPYIIDDKNSKTIPEIKGSESNLTLSDKKSGPTPAGKNNPVPTPSNENVSVPTPSKKNNLIPTPTVKNNPVITPSNTNNLGPDMTPYSDRRIRD